MTLGGAATRVLVRLALGGALVLGACAGPSVLEWGGEPGVSDLFQPGQLEALTVVRDDLEAGRRERALERLVELGRVAPQNLTIGSLRQDLELELLESGGTIESLTRDLVSAARSSEGSPRTLLRRWYALRAEEGGTVQELVLAARIEDDELAALRLLDEALGLDPREIWAHFGRAHVLVRLNRLADARAALNVALELDAGHPRVRALEAALIALEGDRPRAIRAHVQWLRETGGDPRVSGDIRDQAILDLVELELAEERYDSAYGRLMAFEPRSPALAVRRLLDLVVAADGVGSFDQALASAREAAELDPSEFRAHIQEAKLLEVRFGDRPGARDAWRRAAESAGAASSGGEGGEAALQLLAAQVELARLERALGEEVPGI